MTEKNRNDASWRDVAERRKASEFIDVIFEALTHPFYIIDANNYSIIKANAAAGFAGKSSEEMTCYALTHKRDKPCTGDHLCPLEEVKRTKRPATMEHIHYDKDGGSHFVEVHGYPIFDDAGNVVQMIEHTIDITERRKAEEAFKVSEEIFRNITESAQDAILGMDNDGRISSWNRMAEVMFGYPAEEALGKELHALLSPKRYYDAYRKAFPHFQKTGEGAAVGKTFELAAVRKDGTEFLIELSLSAFKMQGAWCATGVVRDITERKQSEKLLDEKMRELEKFNRLAVDRELKHVELKAEINCLLEKLGKKSYYGAEVDAAAKERVEKMLMDEGMERRT